MQSNHTPGPWIWGKREHGLYGAGPDNEVLTYYHYEGMHVSHTQHREANIALIAAAPDMYASIKSSQEIFKAMMEAFGGDYRTLSILQAQYAANLEILKKVERK